MSVEKHKPVGFFVLVPLERDPVLDQLDQLLDEGKLFQAVKADLARRHPHTLTCGRHSTPVEVILRMLVVKHLYKWNYEKTERFVAGSITLRQFCRVYLEQVPDDSTLNYECQAKSADEPASLKRREGEIRCEVLASSSGDANHRACRTHSQAPCCRWLCRLSRRYD